MPVLNGKYVWLSAVTGARRGEVAALQWEDVDLPGAVVTLDENYVRGPDGMLIKDTKTHQGRRVALDPETVVLLEQRKAAMAKQPASLRLELTGKTWVFSAKVDFSRPRGPGALTRRYARLVAKLGIETQHYAAWVGTADKAAAATIGSKMPKLRRVPTSDPTQPARAVRPAR